MPNTDGEEIKATQESLFVHPPEWYRDHQIDLRLGESATSIQPAGHTVTLPNNSDLRYDKLLLATGSRP